MQSILNLLPEAVRDAGKEHFQSRGAPAVKLVEISADKGKPVVLRFSDDTTEQLLVCMDLVQAVSKLREAANCGEEDNDPFSADNRMGLDGTLHRISAIRSRDQRSIIGLTYCIGRHTPEVADLMLDILAELQSGRSGKLDGACPSSVLLVGPPGAGKTTLLRDIASKLANVFDKRVLVVDTNNEIGGDGVVSHACLGKARCVPVHHHFKQHEVMLQAVQNHNPQVVVVGEIGSSEALQAIRSIAQHGVIVVASALAISLRSLIGNTELNALVGGVHEAGSEDVHPKNNDRGSKTTTERKDALVFRSVVEVLAHDQWRVHTHVNNSVDALLAGRQPDTQLRTRRNQKLVVRFETAAAAAADKIRKDTQTEPSRCCTWLTRLGKLAN